MEESTTDPRTPGDSEQPSGWNRDGTFTVRGDRDTLLRELPEWGVTMLAPVNGGLMVGTSQAHRMPDVLAGWTNAIKYAGQPDAEVKLPFAPMAQANGPATAAVSTFSNKEQAPPPPPSAAWGPDAVREFSRSYPALAGDIKALDGLVRDGFLTPEQAQQELMKSPRAKATLRSDYEKSPGSTNGPSMSSPKGDGLFPVQRFLKSSEPLYASPIGSSIYGIARGMIGMTEEQARAAGAAGTLAEGLGSLVTAGGSAQKKGLEPVGREKRRPEMDSEINLGKQKRHLKGTPDNDKKGGGYFLDAGDAQDVFNAYQNRKATIVARHKDGGDIVRYDGVTGYNNNRGAVYIDQPTNLFWIKGREGLSVVPLSPNKDR
ncbi:MAG: hypothetical protein V4505_11255 [Pseudomonadota bacterium]